MGLGISLMIMEMGTQAQTATEQAMVTTIIRRRLPMKSISNMPL
jgi:hypothetical protein